MLVIMERAQPEPVLTFTVKLNVAPDDIHNVGSVLYSLYRQIVHNFYFFVVGFTRGYLYRQTHCISRARARAHVRGFSFSPLSL